MSEPRHCDDYIGDHTAPKILRQFLLLHRLPATEKPLVSHALPGRIYATFKGKPVVLTMASRMGDVGINPDVKSQGYKLRVAVDALSNFRAKP